MEDNPKIAEIKIKTTPEKNESQEDVVELGYTSSDKSSRDESGHYSFDSAKEIDVSSNKCYAKQYCFSNGQNKYYVKFGPDGKMFNPWGMYSEGTESKSVRNESYWRFRKTTKKCFDFYLRFLQSRNSGWLKNAEREIG